MELVKRTITGVLFVAVLVCCITYGPYSALTLFEVITILAISELIGLVNSYRNTTASKGWTASAAVPLVALVGTQGLVTVWYQGLFLILFLLLVMVIFIRELYMKKESPVLNLAVSSLAIVYIAIPFALLTRLAFLTDATGVEGYSFIIPLALFIFIWCNDVGAYCFGCTLGKHRLFERVSPKKSWEGFFGGCFTSALAAYVVSRIPSMAGNMSSLLWIGMALTVSVFGTWGDLVESLIKRELGVKDSGNILPGHGGMLDRFDSTLMAVPAVAAYLYLLFVVF